MNKIKIPNVKLKTQNVYFVCAAICIISIIVIIIAILNRPIPISDDYFVSDDTKTTISLSAGATNNGTSHTDTYVVYTNEGDKITSAKTYFKFTDAETARAAYDSYKTRPEFTHVELNDKYIIATSDASQFEGLTVNDIHQQAEAINKMQAEKNQQSQSESQAEEQPEEQPTE